MNLRILRRIQQERQQISKCPFKQQLPTELRHFSALYCSALAVRIAKESLRISRGGYRNLFCSTGKVIFYSQRQFPMGSGGERFSIQLQLCLCI